MVGRFRASLLALSAVLATTAAVMDPVAADDVFLGFPIYINGDDDLTPENGVARGTGTEDDPYVIEDMKDVPFCESVIEIIGTSKHLLLRNLSLSKDPDSSYPICGITLINCGNCTIERVTIDGFYQGILIKDWSTAICIRDTTFEDSRTALNCLRSYDVTIENNTFVACDSPISLYECEHVDVDGNSILDAYTGVLAQRCRFISVWDNDISSCSGGVVMMQTSDSLISGNSIELCSYAIVLRDCTEIEIQLNDLDSNERTGYDDNYDANEWSIGSGDASLTPTAAAIVIFVVAVNLVMLALAIRRRRHGTELATGKDRSRDSDKDEEGTIR